MSNIDRNSTRGGFLSRAWESTKVSRERHAQRMAAPYLLKLDDEQLKGIGYSRDTLRSWL
ncbi:hypothetical protein KL86PLE_40370 [uncultured Pleomorphomonas sp.]|uniref:DUF1127 domain-containing protein n=2 Tax=Pleomorphomonas TaxID=261933 RepID=A0A2G9WYQ7_9HYPH|nr:hypothetical protein [Pleomorphomonas carboxyditropha]PIO99432.1 hypothetical protein CJ014_08925 [Pleomorphomonas carboxyditropha]SCM76565.1 hypothetical protein KL86PLE_40370 [uncultured Pleomorphomonas sp.]